MQQQLAPNYMSKLNIKRMEKKMKQEVRRGDQLRKFLNVEVELRDEDALREYEIYAELGKGAYGVVKMGLSKRTN